jgi:hypothetical protein
MIRIEPPQGALLPAEERLQNVLKAIEDRMREERAMLMEIPEDDPDYEAMIIRKRNFMSGLDIAWSLAKTESLRRGRCASQFTRNGLLPGLNECELEHGHADLHKCMIDGGFLWSDQDAD